MFVCILVGMCICRPQVYVWSLLTFHLFKTGSLTKAGVYQFGSTIWPASWNSPVSASLRAGITKSSLLCMCCGSKFKARILTLAIMLTLQALYHWAISPVPSTFPALNLEFTEHPGLLANELQGSSYISSLYSQHCINSYMLLRAGDSHSTSSYLCWQGHNQQAISQAL